MDIPNTWVDSSLIRSILFSCLSSPGFKNFSMSPNKSIASCGTLTVEVFLAIIINNLLPSLNQSFVSSSNSKYSMLELMRFLVSSACTFKLFNFSLRDAISCWMRLDSLGNFSSDIWMKLSTLS